MTKTNRLGIYIHVPFCIKKCSYCDFLSFDAKGPSQWQEYGIELIKEVEAYGDFLKEDYIVDTVFFGGGTPSILQADLVSEILDKINSSFSLTPNPEITIEANPGTVSEGKLDKYLAAGINRLSIGVQSFDEDLLGLLGRIHGKEEAKEAYKMARRAGFKNINLDLMFAIPTQTLELWQESLAEAIELSPEHLSFYGLSYEAGTPFDEARIRKEIIPIDEGLDRRMYRRGLATLRANGYEHYEISNMAKPGFECKHNLKYWSMEDYLGLGMGSHSFIRGKRFSNTKDWGKYFTVNKVEEEHLNSEYDNISEYIFTGLRRTKGISFDDFHERFGIAYVDYLGERKKQLYEYQDKGLLTIDVKGMGLTEAGIDFSNRILADLI